MKIAALSAMVALAIVGVGAVTDVVFTCNAPITASCVQKCGCGCDDNADDYCDGGADCPSLSACLSDCYCDVEENFDWYGKA